MKKTPFASALSCLRNWVDMVPCLYIFLVVRNDNTSLILNKHDHIFCIIYM